MRALVLAVVVTLAAGSAAKAASPTDFTAMPAGDYVLDKRHATLLARVRHMGLSRYTMRFDRFDAHFTFDPTTPEQATVQVTVDANSLDVGDQSIERLFAGQFLDAKDHPTVTFTSRALHLGQDGDGEMTGDLTLRGVTRPMTFAVHFDGYASGLLGRRAGFSAVGTLDRTEFGSTFLAPHLVDKAVELVIEAEFLKK